MGVAGFLALTDSYVRAGRLEDARKAAKTLLKLSPTFSVERFEQMTSIKDRTFTKQLADNWRKAGLK